MKSLQLGLWGITLACAVGCTDYASSWKFDNPTVRRIQEKETVRHITDDNQKTRIKEYIGKRVRIVFSEGGTELPDEIHTAGRAAALTQDGYFITAYHVVQDRAFYIEQTNMIRRPPSRGFKTSEISRYFSSSRHRGRLVWSNPDADLAILKFPIEGHPYFNLLEANPTKEQIVFSADDEGYGSSPADKRGEVRRENLVGNGVFFAAGSVLDGPDKFLPATASTFSTSLVARRGMSGAPLVTADFKLCGVLSRMEGFGRFQSLRTVAATIDPSLIEDLVADDRDQQTRQRSNKMEDSEVSIPLEWRPMIRDIVKAFTKGDYRLSVPVPGVLPIDPGTSAQIQEYIEEYSEELIELPDETWETSVAQYQGSKRWEFLVDLWTAESGSSDMVLHGEVEEGANGPTLKVGLVYVP